MPFQYGCFLAPQSCARVFVSHLFALGARFRRRASRRITPPAAVSGSRPPAIPSTSGVARWSNTSVWSSWARGVAQLHVHARRDVPAQPPFSWAAKRPCEGSCDVARPPAPLCLWGGLRAGQGQWLAARKRDGPQRTPHGRARAPRNPLRTAFSLRKHAPMQGHIWPRAACGDKLLFTAHRGD